MSYSHDMWLSPVTLTSTTNRFRVLEGATERIVILTAGDYYLHTDSAVNTTYPSLYLAIKAGLEAVSAHDYNFSEDTPTASTSQTSAGLYFECIGAASIAVDFDDVDFTMDPRWFGEKTTSLWTGALSYTSAYTVMGNWYSNTIDSGGAASRKRRDRFREITYSHDRPSDRYALEWYDDTTRRIAYEYVPAAHVFEVAAEDSIYASIARLGQDDTHNAWETVWSALSRGKVVLVCHDIGTSFSLSSLARMDACLLRDEDQARTLSSTATLMRSAGEMYMLDVDLYLVSAGYDH